MMTAEVCSALENDSPDNTRISLLKQKIDDEDYLIEAVQRIAQVLSNEVAGASLEPRSVDYVSRTGYKRRGR